MKQLAGLQSWMQKAIQHPQGAAGVPRAQVERRVQPSDTLTAVQRLDIYAEMYFLRLLEVLAEDFPALRHALGGERFEAQMREYLTACPSMHPNLNGLGRRLPAFLAARPRGRFPSELAALERAVQDAFDGPRAEPLRAEDVAAVPPQAWERTRLSLVPTARLLAAAYPVNRYYQDYRDGKEPGRPARAPSWTLVWRREFGVWRRGLGKAQHALLAALEQGETLAAALGAAASADPDAATPEAIRDWFQVWSADGIFHRIEAPR